MKTEFRAILAFVLAAAAGSLGIVLALLGSMWAAVLAAGALFAAALIVVAL